MIIKFQDKAKKTIFEVEKQENKVSFFIYPTEAEEIGSSIDLSIKDVSNLIKYLQDIKLYQ